MTMLQNKRIKLRALESTDLDFLYELENNESLWEVSSTITPFSRDILKQYLANAHLDIYEAKQLRMVVIDPSNHAYIGLIDLFDYNPQHQRAGIGISVLDAYQNKGYASEILALFIDYAFMTLQLHQIYANIPTDNTNSIALFQKMGFQCTGTKKDWIISKGKYKDVHLYQRINQQ